MKPNTIRVPLGWFVLDPIRKLQNNIDKKKKKTIIIFKTRAFFRELPEREISYTQRENVYEPSKNFIRVRQQRSFANGLFKLIILK